MTSCEHVNLLVGVTKMTKDDLDNATVIKIKK